MLSYFKKAREPMSSYTHFLGIVFSVFATAAMVVLHLSGGDPSTAILGSGLVFGGSMVALYSASSIYHYYNGPIRRQEWLRKLDHSMIYVLIAGSYTPICIKFMPEGHGLRFALAMWAIAGAGILVKLCWMNAPRWLYTGLYLLMGWAIVFDAGALASLPMGAFLLLLGGGLCYTVGAVFYIIKRPNLSAEFGFHELFHLCILAGTFLHVLTVLCYVM